MEYQEFERKLNGAQNWLRSPKGWDQFTEVFGCYKWLNHNQSLADAQRWGLVQAREEALRWAERRVYQAVTDGQGCGIVRGRGMSTDINDGKLTVMDLLESKDTGIIHRFSQVGKWTDEEFLEALAKCRLDRNFSRRNMAHHLGGYERPMPAVKDLTTDKNAQRRSLNGACVTLSGITFGLAQLGAVHPDLTKEEADQWVASLSKARSEIARTITRLKEFSKNG